ncbi:SGNH/GDSL hydrolase family protein [Nitrobacter sp.]|uniref:SGNH/GDSL hydrolase family protein n=1 Tax=unclassified Nitrobacter TaxID=2620411 RepID=UPI002BBF3749|nr:SGNH/GDSL hydrolase family protein [Nitrobacter sp.]
MMIDSRIFRTAGPVALALMLAGAPAASRVVAQTASAGTGMPATSPSGKVADKAAAIAAPARDILNRVPCLPPKGLSQSTGALPHVAAKLAAHKAVVIVAFGSSSTQGHGATSPEFNYPNRLAARLHRKYPAAAITVLNRGKGGEDAPEMIKRLRTEVIDAKPDMVIWQVGTNAVLRNLDPASTVKIVEDGVATIQASGADLVLVDPQYAPAVNARGETAGRMVRLLNKVAHYRHVGIFPRFEVMRDWHDRQSLPFDTFVTKDGLHMNDWGYACFAQLLGDDIIKSVDQVQAGVRPSAAATVNRPL